MTNEQKLVRDWMQKFGQETSRFPSMPSEAIRRLRAKLILEEALETIRALGFAVQIVDANFDPVFKPDLEAIADGCADLKVVTIGTEVACGIDGEHTFKEVMRSNDSKLWLESELQSTFGKNLFISNCPCCMNCPEQCLEEDRPTCTPSRRFLVKDKDGKVIKSPSFSRPNLQPALKLSPAQAE